MGDAYEVRQGDCLDLMHKMPIASVDAVIADPPYMINTKSDGMGKLDPWADYMNAAYWYAELLRAIRRVLSPNGAAWVFMNWRGLTTLNKASCEARWPIGSVLTWAKDWPGTGNLLRSSSELVCLFVGDDFKMPRHDLLDVQTFKPVPTAQRVHPAQKPTELLRFLIEAVCPGGGIVLDPFAGSGSTGVACAETGRRFVGMEMSERYHGLASRRVAEAYAQQRLDLGI